VSKTFTPPLNTRSLAALYRSKSVVSSGAPRYEPRPTDDNSRGTWSGFLKFLNGTITNVIY